MFQRKHTKNSYIKSCDKFFFPSYNFSTILYLFDRGNEREQELKLPDAVCRMLERERVEIKNTSCKSGLQEITLHKTVLDEKPRQFYLIPA